MTEVGGSRRQSRERALSLLYEAESKDLAPAAVLAGLPVEPAPYAADVVSGVGEHLDELDKWITSYARDWTIDRMPALDRALLRMGVFELLQRFSTDESSRFVNGMLARIAETVRPSAGEAVDAEAVGADPAVDDDTAAGEMFEDGFDEEGGLAGLGPQRHR